MNDRYLAPLYLEESVIKKLGVVQTPTRPKLRSLQEPTAETLVLVPSERCNLCCSYCYERHKSAERMTFETAKESIQRAFSELSSGKSLKIEFRGGEPFLEFDFINVC